MQSITDEQKKKRYHGNDGDSTRVNSEILLKYCTDYTHQTYCIATASGIALTRKCRLMGFTQDRSEASIILVRVGVGTSKDEHSQRLRFKSFARSSVSAVQKAHRF